MTNRPASSPGKQWQGGPLTRGIHDYAPRGSILIPDEPPFERFNLSETMRDIGAVIGVSLFLSVTALALSVGVFVLMFVEVH